MKKLIKWVLHIIFKDYQFNRIYFIDLPTSDAQLSTQMLGRENIRLVESQEQFASSLDQRIRDHAWYFDEFAYVYGVYIENELVCVCSFWISGHPNMPRRFSALIKNGAVMVDLLTAPNYRGKGYALAITRFAENDLFLKGYNKLWTWVWHSNTPSIRVFEKAGWNYSHLLLEFQLYGMKDHLRFKLPPWGVNHRL
jgi:RimJ/RimL family protein N-acetyltransferase